MIGVKNPVTCSTVRISPAFPADGDVERLKRLVHELAVQLWDVRPHDGDDPGGLPTRLNLVGLSAPAGWSQPGELIVSAQAGWYPPAPDARIGCGSCAGVGWTCERHGTRYDELHQATCPGPGAACPACNPAGETTWREVIASATNDE